MIRRRRRAPLHVEALEGRRLLTRYADTFTIAATDAYASEANADTATFRVTRNGDASVVGDLLMVGSSGAGYAGTDDYKFSGPAAWVGGVAYGEAVYVAAKFLIGQTETTFTVVPAKDNRVEGTEAVTLTLAHYYDLITDEVSASGTATATIADDPPRFTIAATDATAKEGSTADTAAFALTRSGGDPSVPLTLTFAAGGAGGVGVATPPGQGGADDALAGPGLAGPNPAGNGAYRFTMTFDAGQTSNVVTLRALPDNLVEGPETATLSLANYISSSGGGPATGTASATIADDPPRFTITAIDATAKEADTTDTATFTVTRAGGDLSTYLQVNLAASAGGVGLATPPGQPGTDSLLSSYDPEGNTEYVSFGPGMTARTITLTAIKDSLLEGSETATLSLAGYYSPAGLVPLAGSAVATILDDDPALKIVYTGTYTNPDGSGIDLVGAPGEADLEPVSGSVTGIQEVDWYVDGAYSGQTYSDETGYSYQALASPIVDTAPQTAGVISLVGFFWNAAPGDHSIEAVVTRKSLVGGRLTKSIEHITVSVLPPTVNAFRDTYQALNFTSSERADVGGPSVLIWGAAANPNPATQRALPILPGEAFTANVNTPAVPAGVPLNNATSTFAFTRLILSTDNLVTRKSGKTAATHYVGPYLDKERFVMDWTSQAYGLGVNSISLPEGDLIDPADPTKGFQAIHAEDTPYLSAVRAPYTAQTGANTYQDYLVKLHENKTFRTYLDYHPSNRLGPGLWLAVASMDITIAGDATFTDQEPGIHTDAYYASPTSWTVSGLSPAMSGTMLGVVLNPPEQLPNWKGKK